MAGLARWCFEHRWRVVAAWLLALVAIAGVGAAAGTNFTTNLALERRQPLRAGRASPDQPVGHHRVRA